MIWAATFSGVASSMSSGIRRPLVSYIIGSELLRAAS